VEQEHASSVAKSVRVPWNKGKLVGATPPLRPSHVRSIRTKLQIEGKRRDLAFFNWQSTASCDLLTRYPLRPDMVGGVLSVDDHASRDGSCWNVARELWDVVQS
jgi:hypothetical protein